MRKLVFLTIIFLIIYFNANAQNNSFQIGMDLHYEDIRTELTEYTYSRNSIAQEISSDYIQTLNELQEFNNTQLHAGIKLSYKIFDDFNAYAFTGLAFARHEAIFKDSGILDYTFSNTTPGYYIGGGMDFSYNLYDKISAKISGELKYTKYSDVQYTDPNSNSEEIYNTDIEQSFLRYSFPLVFQYDFEFIKPCIGIIYYNYLQDIKYHGNFTDDFNDEYLLQRDYKFKHNTEIGAVVNVEIFINESSSVVLNGLISDAYAFDMSFKINI